MSRKKETISYTNNRIGSGQYCECGHELTHQENQRQARYGHKMCGSCMNDYCDHVITGE